jgi:phage gpG-like protein
VATTGSRVEVRGVAQLRRALRRAGDDLTDLKATHREVAMTVARATRPPVVSGRLFASVRAYASKTYARVGSQLRYAAPIHYGWPARNIAPNEFLVDAVHSTEPRWLNIYLGELDAICDRVERAADGTGP